MIIWFCGQSGAGKTTLADKFRIQRKNVCFLDTDIARQIHCVGLGYSKKDRIKSCLKIARVAKDYENDGLAVIVSVIAPYKELRQKIKKICNPVFIRVDHEGSKGRDDDAPFEELDDPLSFNIQV